MRPTVCRSSALKFRVVAEWNCNPPRVDESCGRRDFHVLVKTTESGAGGEGGDKRQFWSNAGLWIGLQEHIENMYATSLPLVSVRRHGRVTQWKSR